MTKTEPGTLWIGGSDNIIVEVLGAAHKPNLRAVRYLSGNSSEWIPANFVASKLISHHESIVEQHEELKQLLNLTPRPPNFRSRVADIRQRAETSNVARKVK
jgi:hypothetical protein